MLFSKGSTSSAVAPATYSFDGNSEQLNDEQAMALVSLSHTANPRNYDLIEQFNQPTDVPVVLNTSFNENEPIVCTPLDAIECFLKTRIDVLYLGNQMIKK
jgi:predicted NodU family carbamoyl transferase